MGQRHRLQRRRAWVDHRLPDPSPQSCASGLSPSKIILEVMDTTAPSLELSSSRSLLRLVAPVLARVESTFHS